MTTVAGRVEARLTIPSGGAAISASNGAQSAAQALTIPAANYFHTSAGGVSSLLTTLQSYLNDNVQGYPTTSAAMQAALGYGTWTSGSAWLLNEASGNLAPAFGATTLTATSLVYGSAGPAGGIDKAISFDAGTDRADGGDIHDVTGTDDLIVAWVAKIASAPVGTVDTVITKMSTGAGWQVNILNGDGTYYFQGFDATPTQLFLSTVSGVSGHIGEWHVGIATIDRSTGKARIGTRSLAGVSSVDVEKTVAATTMANAVAFRIGDRADNAGLAPTTTLLAAAYVVTGSGVATGLSANLSTALTNFANAVNSSFTVSLSTTTGLATISNSFWPSSVAWTNTSLRDVLGFAYDFDYPQTQAQMATALGFGNWTAGGIGWLCNEASGNLAAVFGGLTLFQDSTPTYSNYGPRGGSDKAVGFNSAADRFTAGNFFDVGPSDDLILVWVGYHTSLTGNGDLIGKGYGAGNPSYLVVRESNEISFYVRDSDPDSVRVAAAPVPANTWYVGVAVLDRTTNKSRIGICTMAGAVTLSAESSTSAVGSLSNASDFALGNQGVYTPDTGATVAALYALKGASAATGLSANLSTALSSFATYMKSQTGTLHARGLWLPDTSFMIATGDPRMAPKVTDKRDTESPTGVTTSLVGTYKRKHRNVQWTLVTNDRVREESATYDHGSWEWFLDETQFAGGSSWFSAGSPIQIYDHNDYRVGQDASVAGWTIEGVASFNDTAMPTIEGFTGLWNVTLPELVAEGG